MKIGKYIKLCREKKGFSQNGLAKKTNLSRLTIVAYEHGRRSPTLANIKKIAVALAIPEIVLLWHKTQISDIDPLTTQIRTLIEEYPLPPVEKDNPPYPRT